LQKASACSSPAARRYLHLMPLARNARARPLSAIRFSDPEGRLAANVRIEFPKRQIVVSKTVPWDLLRGQRTARVTTRIVRELGTLVSVTSIFLDCSYFQIESTPANSFCSLHARLETLLVKKSSAL
jgi:hypothetical protein